jgi:hypothetical protein
VAGGLAVPLQLPLRGLTCAVKSLPPFLGPPGPRRLMVMCRVLVQCPLGPLGNARTLVVPSPQKCLWALNSQVFDPRSVNVRVLG